MIVVNQLSDGQMWTVTSSGTKCPYSTTPSSWNSVQPRNLVSTQKARHLVFWFLKSHSGQYFRSNVLLIHSKDLKLSACMNLTARWSKVGNCLHRCYQENGEGQSVIAIALPPAHSARDMCFILQALFMCTGQLEWSDWLSLNLEQEHTARANITS